VTPCPDREREKERKRDRDRDRGRDRGRRRDRERSFKYATHHTYTLPYRSSYVMCVCVCVCDAWQGLEFTGYGLGFRVDGYAWQDAIRDGSGHILGTYSGLLQGIYILFIGIKGVRPPPAPPPPSFFFSRHILGASRCAIMGQMMNDLGVGFRGSGLGFRGEGLGFDVQRYCCCCGGGGGGGCGCCCCCCCCSRKTDHAPDALNPKSIPNQTMKPQP